MKSYSIDKYCHIIEIDFLIGDEDRFAFQVYQGTIEHSKSSIMVSFVGKTIKDVEEFIEKQEIKYKSVLVEQFKVCTNSAGQSKKWNEYICRRFEDTCDKDLKLW